MATAAAYLRRSSADDDNPGEDSRVRQETAVKRLCGDDVALYVDWGISGGGDGSKRPEYARLKADIAAGRVGSVCAESLDRLGRSAVELLAFIELCRKHDVTLRTAKESLDTSGAMGRAMVQMTAVFAELELERGKERSAGARAARLKRHQDAGLELPPSLAVYGKLHVTEDGLTRVIDDPDRPIEPILAAYREARGVRPACVLLNERGVPAPKGGTWGVSTLRRILDHYAAEGLVELPPVANSKRTPVTNTRALFAGLVYCQCGTRMTPNAARKDKRSGKALPVQYYCAKGRDSGTAAHGSRWSVSEATLRPILEPEANRYGPQARVRLTNAQDPGAARARLAARRDVYLGQEADGLITRERCRQLVADLDAQLADLDAQARRLIQLWREVPPSWDDIPAMNVHLRRIWHRVNLVGADLTPAVEWAVTPDDEAEAIEAADKRKADRQRAEAHRERALAPVVPIDESEFPF